MTSIYKAIRTIIASVLCCLSASANCEPTGVATLLLDVRPYVGGNIVYIYPQDTSPCGVSIYTLDISTSAGKAAYGIALAALLSGKHVLLEAIAPCAGIYTGLQSIHALPY